MFHGFPFSAFCFHACEASPLLLSLENISNCLSAQLKLQGEPFQRREGEAEAAGSLFGSRV